MPSPQPEFEAPAGPADGGRTPGWRRRHYLVDARYQLRSGVLVGSTALVLLVLLNASLLVRSPRLDAVSTAAVGARPMVEGQSGASLVLLLFGSLAFVLGVLLVGLLESHRTAGAAFAIRRAVDALRDGQPEIRVRLRRNDHLQELARSINRLAETLDTERTRR